MAVGGLEWLKIKAKKSGMDRLFTQYQDIEKWWE